MPQTATPQKQKTGTRQQPASAPAPRTPTTGTEDHVYGVVSVLYHALQGAQTYQQYIADARKASDEELVKFFEQCRDEERRRATRAKQLLVDRVELEDGDDEDEEEDEDDESDEADEE